MSRPCVTFYVPAFNAARYLDRVIPAILAQSYPIERVLIIDDGSKDDTSEVASKYPVQVVRQDFDEGLAASRNRALNLATTELVAAVDSDVVPSPDWLATMVEAMSDETVGAATGRLEERYQDSPADLWRALHMKQNYGPVNLINPGPFSGSNHIIRKTAWEIAGKFDQRYWTHSEDCNMSERILKAGWRITYRADAHAEHLRQDSTATVARAKWGWDYWAKRSTGHYRSWYRILANNLRVFRWRLGQHLGQPGLAKVDLAMLWLHTRWDFEVLWNKRKAPL